MEEKWDKFILVENSAWKSKPKWSKQTKALESAKVIEVRSKRLQGGRKLLYMSQGKDLLIRYWKRRQKLKADQEISDPERQESGSIKSSYFTLLMRRCLVKGK
jgi:hypothetical protein